jgi:hypothetical protein
VTLRSYKPGGWVLYEQVIDQSTTNIFIKSNKELRTKFFKKMRNNPIGTEKTAMQQIILRDLIFLLN